MLFFFLSLCGCAQAERIPREAFISGVKNISGEDLFRQVLKEVQVGWGLVVHHAQAQFQGSCAEVY